MISKECLLKKDQCPEQRSSDEKQRGWREYQIMSVSLGGVKLGGGWVWWWGRATGVRLLHQSHLLAPHIIRDHLVLPWQSYCSFVARCWLNCHVGEGVDSLTVCMSGNYSCCTRLKQDPVDWSGHLWRPCLVCYCCSHTILRHQE